MGQVVQPVIGDVVNLELFYKQDDVGVTGLDVRVSLRKVVDGTRLDFVDNTWKASGWTQKYAVLVDQGVGIYNYQWNSWLSVRSRDVIMADYEVTTVGEEAVDTDMFIFGLTDVIEGGRWKIIDNQMIFFAQDGITPLLTFNLFDGSGLPSEINVKERVKV